LGIKESQNLLRTVEVPCSISKYFKILIWPYWLSMNFANSCILWSSFPVLDW